MEFAMLRSTSVSAAPAARAAGELAAPRRRRACAERAHCVVVCERVGMAHGGRTFRRARQSGRREGAWGRRRGDGKAEWFTTLLGS